MLQIRENKNSLYYYTMRTKIILKQEPYSLRKFQDFVNTFTELYLINLSFVLLYQKLTHPAKLKGWQWYKLIAFLEYILSIKNSR